MLLKCNVSKKENCKAPGITLSTVHEADATLITGEQWRANSSRSSHQVAPRHDEEEWMEHAVNPQWLPSWSYSTFMPMDSNTPLPERFLWLHPVYTVMSISWCFASLFHKQEPAEASLTLPLPPDPEFCTFSSTPSKFITKVKSLLQLNRAESLHQFPAVGHD